MERRLGLSLRGVRILLGGTNKQMLYQYSTLELFPVPLPF